MNDSYVRGFLLGREIMNMFIPEKQQPIAYLYNGVRLPALPYDKYPYTLIFQRPTDGKIVAWQLADPPQIVDGKCVCDATSYIYGHYRADTDDWSDGQYYENKVPGLASADWLIWTNYDIMDGTTVYMEASAPIPIYNEPVNYLYNGVKLPKLPEWDKTVYPYAVIYNPAVFGIVSNGYSLVVTSAPLFATGGTTNALKSTDTVTYRKCSYDAETGTWKQLGDKTTGTFNETCAVRWANYEVLYENGTICTEASEPVPIYE